MIVHKHIIGQNYLSFSYSVKRLYSLSTAYSVKLNFHHLFFFFTVIIIAAV